MTNREKLSKMALIDILMYLHLCNSAHGFTVARCVQYCGDCYKCRMAWLGEQAEKEEELICDEDDKS